MLNGSDFYIYVIYVVFFGLFLTIESTGNTILISSSYSDEQ